MFMYSLSLHSNSKYIWKNIYTFPVRHGGEELYLMLSYKLNTIIPGHTLNLTSAIKREDHLQTKSRFVLGLHVKVSVVGSLQGWPLWAKPNSCSISDHSQTQLLEKGPCPCHGSTMSDAECAPGAQIWERSLREGTGAYPVLDTHGSTYGPNGLHLLSWWCGSEIT